MNVILKASDSWTSQAEEVIGSIVVQYIVCNTTIAQSNWNLVKGLAKF